MYKVIYIASFLMTFCGNLISISNSLFLVQIKHSGSLIIGLMGFTGNFIYTLITFALSRHSNKKFGIFFIYAPLIMGIVYFFIFFSPIPIIFLLLLIGGAASAFFWPYSQKCLSGADDLQIGIYNIFWGGGVIAGSLSAGFIYSSGPFLPYFSALFIYIIIFLSLISHKSKLLSVGNINYSEEKTKETPLHIETVRDIRTLNFIYFFASGSVFYLYPKLGLLMNFSPQLIGSIIGALFISRFITFFLLIDKSLVFNPAIFLISCALFCISCIMVGYGAHPVIVLAGVIILGSTGAVSYHNSLLIHIKYNLKPEIHECIIGAGTFFGSLIAGLLGQIFNLPSAYIIIGSFVLIVGLWHSRHYLFSFLFQNS